MEVVTGPPPPPPSCSCDGKFSFGRMYLNSKKKGSEVKKMSGLIITLLVLKEGLGIKLM
jgi:hypothetical protein